MRPSMPRLYMHLPDGPDSAAIPDGLLWLRDQVGTGAGLVAVPNNDVSETVRDLGRDTSMRIDIMTELRHPPRWQGPILAVFPHVRLLEIIDGMGAQEVLVIPWLQKEVQSWISHWSAQRYGRSAAP
jgi:hypothetical protein